MRYILVLSVSFIFLACNDVTHTTNNNMKKDAVQKLKYNKKIQNKSITSEAIVTFKKETKIQEAREIIAKLDMEVLKVYKTLYTRTSKPMLHIRASVRYKKMIQMLHNNPKISSISKNHMRKKY